jgi:two-component sensor histidine kinase
VPTLGDLVRERTALDAAALDHLHRLVADWQLLADLSFADLVLWVPLRDGGGFVAVAQMRPTTGPTVHLDDKVGAVVDALPLRQAATTGRIYREGDPEWRGGTPIREEAIPVRHAREVVGVVSRETDLATARTPSRLELAYLECAADLAQMIAEGRFPYPGPPPEHRTEEPRVGDGLIRLDAQGRVGFASPNALSAYRRLGLAGDLAGVHLASVTTALLPTTSPRRGPVAAVAEGRATRFGEVDANGAVVQLRSIPLLPGGRRIGALVLVRDVTELRRRDAALVSKDATIREIHHRVKNNLQTVAALLRLQSRRLDVPEARAALEESVRRVSSIALVHETLSQTLDESVAFDEVADRVVAMVRDVGMVGGTVRVTREGGFGVLPAAVATSLAMVLTELLQNALEHGLAGRDGKVTVVASRDRDRLEVYVRDDGGGLPAEFALERSSRLGLQIVRTLVAGELGGTIELRAGEGGGAEAVLGVPLHAALPG